jgi:hypothetical protein
MPTWRCRISGGRANDLPVLGQMIKGSPERCSNAAGFANNARSSSRHIRLMTSAIVSTPSGLTPTTSPILTVCGLQGTGSLLAKTGRRHSAKLRGWGWWGGRQLQTDCSQSDFARECRQRQKAVIQAPLPSPTAPHINLPFTPNFAADRRRGHGMQAQ